MENIKREYKKTELSQFASELGSTSESVTVALVRFAKANEDQFNKFIDSDCSEVLIATEKKGRKADPNKTANNAVKALNSLSPDQLKAVLLSLNIQV